FFVYAYSQEYWRSNWMNTVNPFYEIKCKVQTPDSYAVDQALPRSFDASSADRCPSECSACPSQGQSNQLQSIRFCLTPSVLCTYSEFDPQRRNCLPNDRNDLSRSHHQWDLGMDCH